MEQKKTKASSFIIKIFKLKLLLEISLLFVLAIIATSCGKQKTDYLLKNSVVHRTVGFWLYTDKDLSHDQANISFELFIQNSSNTLLWDSVLAPMKLKDIPGVTNKIIVEKSIPDNEQSLLKAGFRYSIEGVGDSWYFDSVKVGQPIQTVEFNFK